MIRVQQDVFILDTNYTTYCFRILESGHLEHIYYGRKLHIQAQAMTEKRVFSPGNAITYSSDYPQLSLEDICLEMSGYGKGDIREPFIELIHADGSRTTDFLYADYEIVSGKEPFEELPASYGSKDEVEHLTIRLKEAAYGLVLELHYYVYANLDVITRSSKLINEGTSGIYIDRLMSLQLDFDRTDFALTTFHGGWIREMQRVKETLHNGTYHNGSFTGTSSSRINPFFMLSAETATEETGDCYGFNLIYSGNHYEAVQVSPTEKLRIVSGIQPTGFLYALEACASFQAPEAVMTYSAKGFGGMSRNMHAFVRKHIVRGQWKNKVRPVLLNSWEASYFDINEKKLLRLAKEAKDVGIELFVMDDGWFKGRNDDTSSLGDWVPDEKKLPNGLKGLGDKINELGLDFGIWVEPEMVNVNSDLYRAHPDWALQIPGQDHAEGRGQRVLDLTNEEVQDYVIAQMSKVFSSANISYVKWDMNRIISDCYAQHLPPQRQGEVAHRYVLGLYRCMKELTQAFPNILFEGCASGGNRFDLGILCYFPQIWASDNTDAYNRAQIQNGYSYGYPQNTYTAHVSDVPNHQTLRVTPLYTRFHVASFGVLGYECNLGDLDKSELEEIKNQIKQYKKWRNVLQKGTFYRICDFEDDDRMQWCIVSQNQKYAAGLLMQGLTRPHLASKKFCMKGLMPDKEYHFYSLPFQVDIKDFGSLINTASPVHIRPGSVMQDLASRVIKMQGDREDLTAYGDTLMYSGIHVSQPFRSTGFNEEVRLWKDFDSRMYYAEMKKDTRN